MKSLHTLTFTAGLVTLGVELSAARLLDPWFGNSQIVWAGLIGLILLYLASGAWLGGRLADRFPQRHILHRVVMAAAVGVALVPWISPPVLRLAAVGVADFAPGLLAGSMMAILLLFSLPIILLGTVTPWAVRLAVQDVAHAGQVAGRLSALSTAGSILGTFLPVLWLIPAYGTRWTFYILAILLLLVVGGAEARRRGWERWAAWGLAALVLAVALLTHPTTVRAGWDDGQAGTLLFEDESQYNYIAVRQWGSERHLKLNEGVGIHSVYHPDAVLSNGIWDYFLLAPLFNAPPVQTAETRSILLIGLAAGTVSGLFTDIYGAAAPPPLITGVELDPQIIDLGYAYFDMARPTLTAIAADGRRWLAQQPPSARWDLIAVDAYRPPYIPFHLTTVEFFRTVRDHLNEDGVLAINVGRSADNYALVDALAATLAQVFPSVHIIDEPGPANDLGNSLVVATVRPTDGANFAANVATPPPPLPVEFRDFAQAAIAQSRPAAPPPHPPP
ncbi:MAG: fused MFS/spermidine synthase, partial [Caldilineaceae bacterium]|nr:fused MFS/spermidine synthase [Caldilineaceae bacterium]